MMSSWPLHLHSCGMPCLLAMQVTWNILSDMPKSQGLMGSLTVWVGEGLLQQSMMRGYTQVTLCEPSSFTCRPSGGEWAGPVTRVGGCQWSLGLRLCSQGFCSRFRVSGLIGIRGIDHALW